MQFRSNLKEVQGCVSKLATETFNCRRPRTGRRSIGKGLVEVIAGLIRYRTVELQRDENGRPLRSLKLSYLRRKLREGYPATISIRTGEMMELEQLMGKDTITKYSVSMEYGLDEEMQLEMQWFTEGFKGPDKLGRMQNRPPRPIFDLGKDGERVVMDYLDDVAAEYIRFLER